MVAIISSNAAEVTVCSREGLKSSRMRREKLARAAGGEELSAIRKDSILRLEEDPVTRDGQGVDVSIDVGDRASCRACLPSYQSAARPTRCRPCAFRKGRGGPSIRRRVA